MSGCGSRTYAKIPIASARGVEEHDYGRVCLCLFSQMFLIQNRKENHFFVWECHFLVRGFP